VKYSKESDIWSLGCFFAELLGGKPIFAGTSTINQLNRILEITGKPSKEDILSLQSEYASSLFESITSIKTKSLKSLYKQATNNELELLNSLLQFNPYSRLTIEQALENPYFSEFHNEKKERVHHRTVKLPIDDTVKLSVLDYKKALEDFVKEKKKAEAALKVQLIKQQKKENLILDDKTNVESWKQKEKTNININSVSSNTNKQSLLDNKFKDNSINFKDNKMLDLGKSQTQTPSNINNINKTNYAKK